MKHIVTLLICFILTVSGIGQIKIVDSSTGEPVSFATIISTDSLFQTTSNAKGEFIIPSNIKTVYISCIGYKQKEFNISEFSEKIELTYISYAIPELKINAKRIKIYDEVNHVRKRLKKGKKEVKRHSKTIFETINNGYLIERGDIFSTDVIRIDHGYSLNERVFTNYHFDTSSLFIHVDIDRFVRQISITGKGGFKHLLNRGKVKRSNTKLSMLDEDENNFLIKYSIDNQTGYLKFNKTTYEIIEYKIKSNQIDKRLFKSINNAIGIEIDTLVLDYKFNNEYIDDVSFHLDYNSESLGSVKTAGLIEYYDIGIDWLSTNHNPNTIQYDAYLASFIDYDYTFNSKSIFFNMENQTIKLVKDDELAYAILTNLNFAPKTRMWSRNERLGPSNFVLFDQNTEISDEEDFRSDYHKFSIDWMFYKVGHKSNKFIALPSIWNCNEAVFISKSKYNSLLLANLTFDIYEIYKSKFLNEIENESVDGKEEILMDKFYKDANKMVRHMNKISSYGNSLSGLLEYNEYVFSKTGIDNLKKLLDYKNDFRDEPKYSKGDIFLATGNIQQAINFYSSLLENGKIDRDIQKRIYENLIQAYIKSESEIEACKKLIEWQTKFNDVELDLGTYSLSCN